jgi:small subunit ribosomal protein S9
MADENAAENAEQSAEQQPPSDGEQAPTPEQQAPTPEQQAPTPEHAVPSEDAQEIAGAAEDAPLEAIQEAQERAEAGAGAEGEQPAAPQFEPVEGHAVPSEDAQEIAGVAEDAPLEAIQDAGAATEDGEEGEELEEPAPREKPAVPGAHLEVDIVPEGVDPLGRVEADPYAIAADAYEQEAGAAEQRKGEESAQETLSEPISTAAIDLASGARYRATGKRKTAIARVTLKPGRGTYVVNGRALEEHFPRVTLQRNIRQPLETVGYQERMDVIARLHGGGISAQAGALRHGVSRALLEADPNLRGELKRRGFLTRDSRAKERKKAGLKKARKRPQFSKR